MKKKIYKSAINFVVENGGDSFSKKKLEKYLSPEKEREKPPSINRLYQAILESLMGDVRAESA
jgi:hypothetical protein